MIASIGLSIMVQEVMRISSGGRDQWLPPYFHEAGIAFALGGYPVRTGAMGLGVAGLVAALCLGLAAFMALTPAGRWWRAVSEDAGLAALSGIDVGRAVAATFLVAGGFAAAAGGILAVHYGGVSFSMGLMLALKALFAGIIGGFGKISGAIAGALLLATLETGWQAAFDINYRDVAVFAVIILVLMLRPDGLIGRPLRIDQPDRARQAMRVIGLVLSLTLGLALAACSETDDRPYLVFVGGGFVFNYRIGQAFYGFVAKPNRALPEGAMIEARFDVPGSDEPFIARRAAQSGMLVYVFKTPPLTGIVRNHKYKVELQVLEAGTSKVLASYENSYFTDVDQMTLPDKPLVLGPGYAPNPEVDLTKLPAD